MSEVEQIERRIESLSPDELARLRSWFLEFDARAWDGQIERDSVNGRLDALTDESLNEHKAGQSASERSGP